ncbi:YncE family protein [Natronomonas sp.]|uniref:YncE family protein n=1 Tax=Natronomonas sp. TaxID=2184060 RepID=UPI002604F55D|nr:hypothetical protein [Natronomonas sp.]
MSDDLDPVLYPNADDAEGSAVGLSRRRVLAGGAAVGGAAAAGCSGGGGGGDGNGGDAETDRPTVFVFNTGDDTVSLIDPGDGEVVGTRAVGLSSSFPSNQYAPGLTDDPEEPLWLNVGRGVRGLSVGDLSETASFETESGANWIERTPGGDHALVSAREPTHAQFRIDADPGSETFGETTGTIDRTPEGGHSGMDGPGPCDVTIHPDGEYAYVPDIFGDTLTVLSTDPFGIEGQRRVEAVAGERSRPWMATAAVGGDAMLVEHDEGEAGTESVWDVSDPANPVERTRLTAADGLGERPLTSEIGPDGETGYVFTPGTEDVTVIDLTEDAVIDRLDLGGSAFAGTWDPERTALYAPVQTNDEVAVIDHDQGAITDRIDVGAAPYGATSARVRPGDEPLSSLSVALARLDVGGESAETTYCIGECACGHRL